MIDSEVNWWLGFDPASENVLKSSGAAKLQLTA
jgi:hypothetical protein